MLDSAGPDSDPNKLPLTLATCVKGEGEYGNSECGDLILVNKGFVCLVKVFFFCCADLFH